MFLLCHDTSVEQKGAALRKPRFTPAFSWLISNPLRWCLEVLCFEIQQLSLQWFSAFKKVTCLPGLGQTLAC